MPKKTKVKPFLKILSIFYTNVIKFVLGSISIKPRKVTFTLMSKFKLNLNDAGILAEVISEVRLSVQTSRPKIVRQTGYSRTLVNKHIEIGLAAGLLVEGEFGVSTGGRVPRLLEFNPSAGTILLAQLGASGFSVTVSDLSGKMSEIKTKLQPISSGPEEVLSQVEEAFDATIAKFKIKNVIGRGIGLPGPVEFATGIPISPPIMPGWDRYPVRNRLSKKYKAPVWVDNDVNLMALGEHSITQENRSKELVYIKIGSGIGAGILTHGKLHRGAQGCAGDVGHIAINDSSTVLCRCGNVGCLEAVAGGLALARDGLAAVQAGKSAFLTVRKNSTKTIMAKDVIDGAKSGDKWCVDAINMVGQQIGHTLATLVNFHNPSLIVIGGSVSEAGNQLLATIRENIFRRSLPLATRDLEIRLGDSGEIVGLKGAAAMVISELFAPKILRQWVDFGNTSKFEITY